MIRFIRVRYNEVGEFKKTVNYEKEYKKTLNY